MKLIGAEGARLIVSFAAEEIRPEGGLDTPKFIRLTSERYTFVTSPNVAELKGDYNNLSFKTGTVHGDGKTTVISEFILLAGAIVVDAFSSDDAELFFKDIFAWATKEFGLRSPQNEIKKLFISNVIVEFERPVEKMITGLELISSMASQELAKHSNINEPAQFFRLAFNCDPQRLPPNSIRTDFIIERRTNSPYSANRFFCSGPLRTSDLLGFLERFEKAMSGPSKTT
jgi:hypothetical protein